jgi:hypothetical protein
LLAVPQTADQAPDKVSSAQALLVVDIADEFDYNAEALSLVNEKIDELALTGC